MATKSQIAFAQQVYAAARKVSEIAPDFVAAQAVLETGWGEKKVGKYNVFGITKGSQWNGKVVMVRTHEYFATDGKKFNPPDKIVSICKVKGKKMWYYTVDRAFKDFDSMEDCLVEHNRLFQKPGYADAWPYRKNALEFAKRICDGVGCKYATDPAYLTTIMSIIKSVRKYCKAK